MTTEPRAADIIPAGEDMARHTAQAKMLREARDELATRAQALAEKKDRKGLERLGLSRSSVQRLIEGGQFSNEDFAELLGVSLKALLKWLAPADNADHREMPKTAKLLLERILAEG